MRDAHSTTQLAFCYVFPRFSIPHRGEKQDNRTFFVHAPRKRVNSSNCTKRLAFCYVFSRFSASYSSKNCTKLLTFCYVFPRKSENGHFSLARHGNVRTRAISQRYSAFLESDKTSFSLLHSLHNMIHSSSTRMCRLIRFQSLNIKEVIQTDRNTHFLNGRF